MTLDSGCLLRNSLYPGKLISSASTPLMSSAGHGWSWEGGLAFDLEIPLGCTHRSRRDWTWVELGDVGQDMEAGFGTPVLSRPSTG